MAASAMASLPFINTLSAMSLTPFYRNYAIRAHRCAKCTRDTLGLVGHFRRMMAFCINNRLRHPKNLLRAGCHTEAAALTKVRVERYFGHVLPPVNKLASSSIGKCHAFTNSVIPQPLILQMQRHDIGNYFCNLRRNVFLYGRHAKRKSGVLCHFHGVGVGFDYILRGCLPSEI